MDLDGVPPHIIKQLKEQETISMGFELTFAQIRSLSETEHPLGIE